MLVKKNYLDHCPFPANKFQYNDRKCALVYDDIDLDNLFIEPVFDRMNYLENKKKMDLKVSYEYNDQCRNIIVKIRGGYNGFNFYDDYSFYFLTDDLYQQAARKIEV